MVSKRSHCTLILYALLLNFIASSQVYNNSFYPKMNIWHTLRPGELLHTLDLITAGTHSINSPVVLPPSPSPRETHSAPTVLRTFPKVLSTSATQSLLPGPPQIQRRIEIDAENQYSTEDHLNSEHSNEYDYDKAYDQFVQRYFGAARDDALDDVQSGSIEFDEQEPYSAEYESSSEPLTASASKSKPRQRCKKVFKNRQECLICKNPKNNEKSETCSFSTETEPETYAYTKEKSYKKHRDTSDESLEDEDDDDGVDDYDGGDDEHENKKNVNRKNTKQLKRKISPKRKIKQHNIRIRKRNGKDFERRKDTTSSCTRKNYKYKTCYYCTNLGDKNSSRCFAKEADPSNRDVSSSDGKQNQNTKQIQKSEKKIYKRMVTYSYENGTNFNLGNEHKNVAEKNDNIASPRVKRKIIFKLLKHKAIEQN